VPLCFEQDVNCQHPIAIISIRKGDRFKDILDSINHVLNLQGYESVGGFHYLQEDADYAWVEYDIAPETDLIYSLDFDTEFYVAKRSSKSRVRAAVSERVGAEIQGGQQTLRKKERVELESGIMLMLKDIEPIYDSRDVVGVFEVWVGNEFILYFTLSTADIEPQLIWNEDELWLYINATERSSLPLGRQATLTNAPMQIQFSLRVSSFGV
jgi:hypothetical protein